MFSVIYDYIDSIYIYSRAYDRVFTSEGDKPMDELSDINWVRVYSGLENGEFKAWLRKKDDVYPYVYTYMRKTSYNGQDGAVILNINLEKIKSLQPGAGRHLGILRDAE